MESNAVSVFSGDAELHPVVQQTLAVIQAQSANNGKMETMLRDMASLMLALDENNRQMRKLLESKITISGAQARLIADAVKRRASSICSAYALPYGMAGRPIREAIWKEFRLEFTVSTPYDLSATRFDAALDLINDWTSLSTIRRMREKYKENQNA